ncbi:tetratricopeptide repeat protein [Sulfuritortus calidifontis]|uniref:Tetratricopeptide repeat protein n=1 Tax=Sulfuritortus calidifontis TaxID=1914471 RepID=A0A4R3JZB5_9PROT|nr:tetratricopeptide repeat protein [Sulfuritortus calidifontis]TCS72447.1 tetratricopeptide repeat protein [Sulfuritortus calidifontis]
MPLLRLSRGLLLVTALALLLSPLAGGAAPRPVQAPQEAADAKIPAYLAQEEARLAEQFSRPPVSLELIVQLAETRAQIAEALARQGEHGRARDYLLGALALEPEVIEHWERLGDLSVQLEDRALAEQAYRQVLTMDPAHRGARSKLASLALARQDYAAAARHLEIALADETAPREWMPIATLASLYALTGQVAQGRQYFNRMAGATGDDRFVLAEAILIQVAGDGKAAARRLRDIEESALTPELLKQYAERLKREFDPNLLDKLFKWLR